MSLPSERLYFEDIPLGKIWVSEARTITETDVVNFACLSGDFNPIHTNEEFAHNTPFHRRIAHGLLVLSIGGGMMTSNPPVRTLALLEHPHWRFHNPVFFGDTIHVRNQAVDKQAEKNGRRGRITWEVQILNQEGKVVQEGTMLTLVECQVTKKKKVAKTNADGNLSRSRMTAETAKST